MSTTPSRREHAAVLERAVVDVAGVPVDVVEARRDARPAARARLVVEHDAVAVLAQEHALVRDAHAPRDAAWCTRWRYSPWTGTNARGRVSCSSVRSSPWRAWPETWTFSCAECSTSAPRRCRSSMTRPTENSLPGIGCDDRITVSSGPSVERSHVAGREPRQGRQRLALGAGAQHEHLGRARDARGRRARRSARVGVAARRGGGRAPRSSASTGRAARPCGPRARRRGPAGCGAGATRSTRR